MLVAQDYVGGQLLVGTEVASRGLGDAATRTELEGLSSGQLGLLQLLLLLSFCCHVVIDVVFVVVVGLDVAVLV